MIGLRAYLAAGVAAAFLSVLGALWWQTGRVDALSARNAALNASVTALEMDRDLAREARAVADARARRVAEKAREYDQLREGILRDGEDADLPDWLFNVLVGLRPDPNR